MDWPVANQAPPTALRDAGPEALELTRLVAECGPREQNSLPSRVWSRASNGAHHELGHPGHHPRPAEVHRILSDSAAIDCVPLPECLSLSDLRFLI